MRFKKLFKREPEPLMAAFKQPNYLNTYPQVELRDLLKFAEQKHFFNVVPDLKNKVVLFLSQPTTRFFTDKILDKAPHILINYQLEPSPGIFGPHILTIRGEASPLSVKSESFDIFLAPLSTYNKRVSDSFGVWSKSLKNNGRLVFSVMHPALELFLYNQNPSSQAKSANSFQKYMDALRQHHLYLECIDEAFVDKDTKPFFLSTQDSRYYDEFIGIPLVLTMRAVKFLNKK